jgi:hypothetical protein
MNNGRADGHLSTGRQALATADWAEARAAFTAALQLEETAEGYEGLGIAARYQLDGETAITVRVGLPIRPSAGRRRVAGSACDPTCL